MPALPPASFRIATDSSPRSDQDYTYQSFHSAAAARALDHAGPSSLAAKLLWVERLSQPSTPLETMRDATKYIDESTYDDLLVERHMEGLCPYAPCANPASTPYRGEEEAAEDARRLRVRMKGSGLFDASGAPPARGEDKGPFCSIQCRHRSEWYRGILGRDGQGEMLEDVEERRKNVARSTQELVERKAKEDAAAAASTSPPSNAHDAKPTTTTFANDLLASLTIHEKPIPSTPPVAPSLSSASRDFERPSSDPSPNPSSRFPADPSSSSRPLSSPASALLPFSTSSTRSLTRTVLSSTRSPPPPPPPSTRPQPPSGPHDGLPPIRWLTAPRMVDERGRELEWVGVDEEAEDEVTRAWMDEALEVRRRVERGEL
ncbi:hypothetical protein JCM1840_006909 [Sporobolomyces johnsonii]